MTVEANPWDRQKDETPIAYAAFVVYRDLARARSFAAAGRTLGKSDSLIRGWAVRHRWRERAWAWDLHQTQQDGVVARRERDAGVQQLMDDGSRLWRAAMAYFWSLIDRDPETGKAVFGPKFTPAVAVKLCELTLRIQTGLAGRPDALESDQPADPFQLSSAELTELIGLARELTQGKEQRDEDVQQQ